MNENPINLNEIIAPAFYNVFWDILDGKHTYYDLYGGRGSTKSSFVGVMIPFLMMQDSENGIMSNTVIFRKVGNTLRESVYEQIAWGIDALGANELWDTSVSPMQYTYKPTGQKIIFRGLDKAKKTKSIKASKGYFKYLWFEELDEFSGIEEIRTVQQSVLRGGSKFVVFKTFNPPISWSNWANVYVEEPRDDSYRHKSDYRSVPVEWLGQQFLDDAEHLRKTNQRAYDHEYLGLPVGLGTNIFELLEIRDITDEEISRMDRVFAGVDYGWYPDQFCYLRTYYDSAREKIYLIDELYVNKWSNSKTADWIKKKGYDDYTMICDSAEPKSVNDFRDAGLPARGAIKGPGSIEYGFKFLQTKTIVIDPKRTPNAYKEITEYEYDRDKEGNVISGYPDGNDHAISALRYAYEPLFNRRGYSA